MDKAQESRPLDKAFPGDPELQERGPLEQQVTGGLMLEKGGRGRNRNLAEVNRTIKRTRLG